MESGWAHRCQLAVYENNLLRCQIVVFLFSTPHRWLQQVHQPCLTQAQTGHFLLEFITKLSRFFHRFTIVRTEHFPQPDDTIQY